MPDEFHARQLTIKVFRLADIDCYPDTIMHTLRYMRRDGLLDYDCLNRQQSRYRKGKK